jgi:hypothetical protein
VNWAKWRERLTYLAMSFVVGWHSLAMMISPAPNGSVLVQSLRDMFHPYLLLFRLETPWGFFAPVGKHAQFRYVVHDAAGNEHIFIPTEEPSPSIAHYVWWREFKYLYDGIMASPEFRGQAAGELFCQRHASLKPRSVTLLEVVEQAYGPDDELRGKLPLDPQFAAVVSLKRVECPNDSSLPPDSLFRLLRKPS